MADPREFVLIGSFTDNITPSLEKINKSINSLKTNLGGFSSKRGGFNDLTQSMGKVIGAHIKLSEEVRTLRSELTKSIPVLQEYRKEVGKTASANTWLQGKGKGQRFTKKNNPTLQFLDEATRRTQLLAQTSRGVTIGGRIPRGGGGSGNGNGPRPPRSPVGGVYGGGAAGNYGGGGYGGGYAGAVGGGIIGNQLAGVMTSAIVQGFQIGTRIMEAPFKYFQNALGERIKDEMSDLKAAGGLYSIAKRQKDPFVKTMDQAIQYTQANNLVLAKLASALPGNTQDYIEVSKRISDTVTRVVAKDVPAAIKEANMIRSTDEGRKFYGGNITATGQQGTQQAITTLLGELTKKTVLAGFGGRSGAGGAMGPYGLPGLSERLISQDQVSVGQFQRYSAIFSDPQILDALQRNIGKINATQKDSIERYKVLNALYDDILPPELIEKFRRSVSGINEAIASATVNPEVGLFGIGRKMTGLGRAMNDFGQYVDETGKVVTDVNQAFKSNLSLYDLLRDIYAQTAQVLVPIIEILPQLWDPLRKIGETLSEARHYTGQFLKSFISYKEGLKTYAQTLGEAGKLKIMGSLDIRSSLLAISNLFKQLNVIGSGEFADLSKQLVDPNANIGKILQTLIDKLFNSKVAEEIGAFLGKLIGTVLRQVADATSYIANAVEGGGFAGGFSKAFKDAGGFSGIQDIFVNIVKLFVKAIGTAIKEMPLLSGLAVAFAVIPGIIGAAITAMVERCMGSLKGGACAMPGGGRRGRRGAGRGGSMGGYDGGYFGEQRSMRAARLRKMRQARDLGRGAQYAAEPFMNLGKTSRVGQGLGKVGQGIGKVGKFIPGGAVAAGAVDMGVALASGENFGKAAAGALGTVLGGAAGSIFGPAGTVVGSIAGGMIGDAVANAIASSFAGPTDAQREAARAQLFAAQAMKGIPTVGGKDVGAAEEYAGTGIVGISQLNKAFRYAGLESDKSAQSYITAANNMANLRMQYQALNDEAAKQKAQAGGRVSTDLQAKLDASRATLAAAESKTAAAWDKITATNKSKINNAIVQMQTNTTAFNNALSVQALNVAKQMQNAANVINAAKLTPDAVNKLSQLLPPAPTTQTPTVKGGKPAKAFGEPGVDFSSLSKAVAFENKYKPPGSSLVVANSSETIIPAANGFIPSQGMYSSSRSGMSSAPITVSAPITIHQQPNQDAEELASMVAMKIGEAVADARAASVFV
jgi:hypothetical protein